MKEKKAHCTMSEVMSILKIDYARQEVLKKKAGVKTFLGRKNKYQKEQQCYTEKAFIAMMKAGFVVPPKGSMVSDKYVKDIEDFNSRL